MIYRQVVPLNIDEHKNLKVDVDAPSDFRFAFETHLVSLTLSELAQASKYYTTRFVKINDHIQLVGLLGLRENENLYINEKNQWETPYIPAYIRHYPFMVDEQFDKDTLNLTIYIDLAFSKFNYDQGEPLFTRQLKPSPLLQQNMDFLAAFRNGLLETQDFIEEVNSLDLFVPAKPIVISDTTERFKFDNHYNICEQKLQNIQAAQLKDLVQSGSLGFIYAHLRSIANQQFLIQKLMQQLLIERKQQSSAILQ